MVTRRSASIAASTQNSRASSAIHSEVEDNLPNAIRSGHLNMDEKAKARKVKISASRSNRSRSRASSAQEERKAEGPRLKLFAPKPPESIELEKIKHTLRNRKGAVPPTTQISTERSRRKREARRERDERAAVAHTTNKGDSSTILDATTQLITESNTRKYEAVHDDAGTTDGEKEGTSSKVDTQLTTESNKEKRDVGHGDEKTNDVVDMAGMTGGASNGTPLSVNTETPLESNKRKREAGHEDGGGALVADTTNGEIDARTSGVDTEQTPGKKRGRIPKLKTEQVITSVELTPATETSNGNPEIPAPAVKRPPGRPRKGVPPVSRPGSETAARRLPGRQRAPDANPEVEAIRIRMADLKRNYRDVARGQEAALNELAERSIDELRDGPNAHEQNDYFRVVKAGLDARYVNNVVEREQNYQRMLAYEDTNLKAQKEVLWRECKVRSSSIEKNIPCADDV